MAHYLLALDQGTSSSRALLFDERLQLLHSASVAFDCVYPHAGWVEQDPRVLWQSQLQCIQTVLQQSGIDPHRIAGIGITNQRETFIAWHRDTGEPLHNAIVWQCKRSQDICTQLKNDGHEANIQARTGLVIDPYFSASKMQWLLQNHPAIQQLQTEGKLCLGTVDSWLIWQLSGGKQFITDASNASRTQLYNLEQGDWDDELLSLFGIARNSLATVVDSCGKLATTDASIFGVSIPICGILGDQQAALFGQQCVKAGDVKHTYGTGGFMLMNTGSRIVHSTQRLLSTVAWQIKGQRTYALEGSVFIAGALVQWLRDQLQLISRSADIEALAQQVDSSDGVYIVPAFSGLGAPYWNADARAIIGGLTRGSSKAHIARAALEAVAMQTVELRNAMQIDSGLAIKELRVDGGMAANNLLCQIQADQAQCRIIRAAQLESTALGAARIAAIGAGLLNTDEAINQNEQQVFEAHINTEQAAQALVNWQKAVARALL